mgnify:CR=1 FL=1
MKISGKLSHQLFLLILVIFAITFLMLGIILPQVVVPITEKNIYNYLNFLWNFKYHLYHLPLI